MMAADIIFPSIPMYMWTGWTNAQREARDVFISLQQEVANVMMYE